jgi:hypothetical protein
MASLHSGSGMQVLSCAAGCHCLCLPPYTIHTPLYFSPRRGSFKPRTSQSQHSCCIFNFL